jgi:hypothetical protein
MMYKSSAEVKLRESRGEQSRAGQGRVVETILDRTGWGRVDNGREVAIKG